jgi:hypothetical protein
MEQNIKIEKIIKHALSSEYKLWTYYYNENCSYHSYYAALFQDIKTTFIKTSKEIMDLMCCLRVCINNF